MAEDRARLPAGRGVKIEVCAPPERIAGLKMHPELNIFRPPERQKQALVGIAASADGCVTLATDGDQIVGYAAFHRPDPFERWGRDQTGGIYELGAVEVAPAYRGQGLARRMLEATFQTGRFDDKVVVAALYYWHYDLERTGLSAFAYRDLLERLYKSVGFSVYPTDDPDIYAHVENALMARIGPHAPEKVKESFEALRFTHEEGPWGCL